MDSNQRAALFDRVERATEMPMLILSVVLIPVLLLPVFLALSETTAAAFDTVEWFIWAAFALELTAKTYLAPSRVRHLRTHWFDVAIVLLPFLRPLRLLRSMRALRAARLVRLAALGTSVVHTARAVFGRHGMHYFLAVGLTVCVASAAVVPVFERDAGGSIDSFGTALWWVATTITTVGYGDAYPTTPEGRGIAVVLMFFGVGLFGLLSANLAAFFVQEGSPTDTVTLEEIMVELQDVKAQLTALRGEQRTGP